MKEELESLIQNAIKEDRAKEVFVYRTTTGNG